MGNGGWGERRGAKGAGRVYRAILKLSEGKIDRLRYYTAQAELDFRDVLYWAEDDGT
jgi:hypothetical protein